MFARCLLPLLVATVAALPAAADGPADNLTDKVPPVPPRGPDFSIPHVEASARDFGDIPIVRPFFKQLLIDMPAILKGLAELQAIIKDIGKHELLPDVLIYEKAVRWALDYREVFDPRGIAAVKNVLKTGIERAKAMKEGKTPWTAQTGLVVRGYRSKIDGSVQPYGLVIPKEYDFAAKEKHRLDFWWHGRGETLSEVNFIQGRQTSAGEFTPAGALVLHPYGRYCNANKFAGEIDTFECLEHAKKHYRIDESRIVARGFSMGGAACWQFAVHYPTLWCANAPGAGFSETPEFLKVFQKEDVKPTWYEQKLWHMYNATDYAANIFNLPTVAYSGEIDLQKQAADVMAREMKKEGLELVHIIGPKTGHSYEKAAKEELNKRIDAIVEKGKSEWPAEVKFVTYTLRYNAGPGVTVDALDSHWKRARVEGTWAKGWIRVKTENVAGMTLRAPGPMDAISLNIDGTPLTLPAFKKAGEVYSVSLRKENGKWVAPFPPVKPDPTKLAKIHGLQGPIDDAFMDAFVMVAPTGKPFSDTSAKWVEKEMKHAVAHWRSQFRGDAPVKKDSEITDDDIKNSNLILWGDPGSNAVLAKIADKLPVKWTGIKKDFDKPGGEAYPVFTLGKTEYRGDTQVPVLIYPNPLNPKKYVVLNSGFTFREYDYLNNARQVSKLPDYAIVDITTPPNARYPGKIVRAGFFGEKWELLTDDGK